MTDKTATQTPPVHYFYYVRMPEVDYHMIFDSQADRARHDREGVEYCGSRPIACVCVSYFKDLGVYSRGISICSPKDAFVKRLGRAKASAYAARWNKDRTTTDVVQACSRSKALRLLVDYIDTEGDVPVRQDPDSDEYVAAVFGLKKEELTPREQLLVDDRPAKERACGENGCSF